MAADPVSILFKRIGNDMYPRRHIKVSGQIWRQAVMNQGNL